MRFEAGTSTSTAAGRVGLLVAASAVPFLSCTLLCASLSIWCQSCATGEGSATPAPWQTPEHPGGMSPNDAGVGIDSGSAPDGPPPVAPTPEEPFTDVQVCALVDGPPKGSSTVIETRVDEAGTSYVYIAGIQYVMTRASPCVLERFGGERGLAVSLSQGQSIAGDGSVWGRGIPTFRRFYPHTVPGQPAPTCDVENADAEDSPIAIVFDGNQMIGNAFIQRAERILVGRVTIAGAQCHVTNVVEGRDLAPGRVTRDSFGRLHVVDGVTGAIEIRGPGDVVVRTYVLDPDPAKMPKALAITRCGRGMCVLGSTSSFSGLFYFDDDGVLRETHGPRFSPLHDENIAGASTGPVFTLGWDHHDIAYIQVAPAPSF